MKPLGQKMRGFLDSGRVLVLILGTADTVSGSTGEVGCALGSRPTHVKQLLLHKPDVRVNPARRLKGVTLGETGW